MRQAIDRAIDDATNEMQAVFGDSPIAQVVPVCLIAVTLGAVVQLVRGLPPPAAPT